MTTPPGSGEPAHEGTDPAIDHPDPDAADDTAVPAAAAVSGDDPELQSRRAHREHRARPKTPWERARHALKEVLIIGGTALVISFLIKTFVAQAFWIPSGSMEDTLIYGDRVLVSKITSGPMSIERGDIAVFRDPGGWLPETEPQDRGPIMGPVMTGLEFVGLAPASDGDHLIKRVVATGGDHVICCDDDGRITVNGYPLEEDYLFPGDAPSRQPFDVLVPEDHYWMMGDHRSNSRDSRSNDDGTGANGAVPAENMVGRAVVLVWPLDRWNAFDGARDVYGDVPEPSGQ